MLPHQHNHPHQPPRPYPPPANTGPVVDTNTIRCLCQITADDGATIYCDGCGYWQHMSCVGLANKSETALPENWYCWDCAPEKFEWIHTLNGSSGGETMASSLGISPTHWNTSYSNGYGGHGLFDTSGSGTAGSSSSARSASSSLRISNLLIDPSPAPNPPPPPPPPPPSVKIVLDPVKAKKKQEARQIEEERLKKHQQQAASALGQNIIAPIIVATTAIPAATATPHARKPSVAQGDKPKGRKPASAISALNKQVLPDGAPSSSAGAGPSTAGPSMTPTVPPGPFPAMTAPTTAKRKPSNASAAFKNRKDYQPSPVNIPDDSTLHFNQPLPVSTPRSTHATFVRPISPRAHIADGTARSSPRSRSLSIDRLVEDNGDIDMFMEDGFVVRRPTSDGDDYYAGAFPNGRGKGKEKEVLPTPLTPKEGVMTPYGARPYLPNTYPPPLPRVQYAPRPMHPVITSLGKGTRIAVAQGASTGSAVSRPKLLIVRSFPTSGLGLMGESSRPGLSLFLDPQPPPPLPPPTPELHPSVPPPLAASVDRPFVAPTPATNTDQLLPSPTMSLQHPLQHLAGPPTASPVVTDRHTSLPTLPSASLPNAVVRPLLCGTCDGSVTFGVFAVREFLPGDPISLGWEMTETSIESRHVPTSPISTLSYIADTFTTCGSCARNTSDCLVDVLKKLEEEKERAVRAVGVNLQASKRTRAQVGSPLTPNSPLASERPTKRPKLTNGYSLSESTPTTPSEASLPTPSTDPTATAAPEVSLGVDLSLRRLQLVPGEPVPPNPRARFRASWKTQMEQCQASQAGAAIVPPSTPVGLGISTPGYFPFVPSQPPPTIPPPSKKVATPSLRLPQPVAVASAIESARSMSSSPLTEQSESGEDDSERMLPEPPTKKSPRLVNGRSSTSGGGKRPSKVRIESTPPSDTDEQRRSSVLREKQPEQSPAFPPTPIQQDWNFPATPVTVNESPSRVLDLRSATEQKGPPRFRKWSIRSPDEKEKERPSETTLKNPFGNMEVFPTAVPPLPPRPLSPPTAFSVLSLLAAAPIMTAHDEDDDVEMETNGPAIFTPPRPLIAPTPPSSGFSIRNLLNPAPEKPRSRLQVSAPSPVVEARPLPPPQAIAPPIPAPPVTSAPAARSETAPVPSNISQIKDSAVTMAPSFVRTSSPTLNLLLSAPRPSTEAKMSPLVAEITLARSPPVIAGAGPEPPGPSESAVVVDRSPSPQPPLTEKAPIPFPVTLAHKVEMVEATLDIGETPSVVEAAEVLGDEDLAPRNSSVVVEPMELTTESSRPYETPSREATPMQTVSDVTSATTATEPVGSPQLPRPTHVAPSPSRPDEECEEEEKDQLRAPDQSMDIELEEAASSPLSDIPPDILNSPIPRVPEEAPEVAGEASQEPKSPEDTTMQSPSQLLQSDDNTNAIPTPIVPFIAVPPNSAAPASPNVPAVGIHTAPGLTVSSAHPDHQSPLPPVVSVQAPSERGASSEPATALSPVVKDGPKAVDRSSPAPSSVTAPSPAPRVTKLSFADYARRRKAARAVEERQKEKGDADEKMDESREDILPKEKEREASGGALKLVLEGKDNKFPQPTPSSEKLRSSPSDARTSLPAPFSPVAATTPLALVDDELNQPQLQLPLPDRISASVANSPVQDQPALPESPPLPCVGTPITPSRADPGLESLIAASPSRPFRDGSLELEVVVVTMKEDTSGPSENPQRSPPNAEVATLVQDEAALEDKVEETAKAPKERFPSVTPNSVICAPADHQGAPSVFAAAYQPATSEFIPTTPPRPPEMLAARTASLAAHASAERTSGPSLQTANGVTSPHSTSSQLSQPPSPDAPATTQRRCKSKTPVAEEYSPPSSHVLSRSPQTPPPIDQATPHPVQQKGSSDDDENTADSSKLSPISPVVPEKKLTTKLRSLSLLNLPSAEAPLNNSALSDVAKRLRLATIEQERGQDRYNIPPPPPPPPARKPPTEPRSHGRNIPPINTSATAAEEGEITSSPVASPATPGGRNGRTLSGPSSTGPIAKPRFYAPPIGLRTPPRGPSPPPSPYSSRSRPVPLTQRVGPPPASAGPSVPTGPRALRGGAPRRDDGRPERLPDRRPYRDDRDDRDRGRDRDRDRSWGHVSRGRGRGRGGWGGR